MPKHDGAHSHQSRARQRGRRLKGTLAPSRRLRGTPALRGRRLKGTPALRGRRLRGTPALRGRRLKGTLALSAAAALAALAAVPAQAGDGGTATTSSSGTTGHARLVHGKAIPPSDAPWRVVEVIEAANHIRKMPYRYGGGHGSWNDSGYDCSGSVSYALHGGRLLRRPLDSSGFMHWARRGKGDWITVFANPGHAFMIVAGLRFDTSMVPGSGPGWSRDLHAERWSDFRKRHKRRF